MADTPSTTPSVRVVKTIQFRGSTREFSNRYHFNGGTPSSLANWEALFDAIVTAEKAVYMDDVTIVKCVGYAAGSELPVHEKEYTTGGTAAFGLWQVTPVQDAALVRYSTTARSSKNHPIYLFNYYHGAGRDTSAGRDDLNAAQQAALETYAALWVSGITAGGITAVRAGPHGATAVSRHVSEWITHRDFSL